jgi:protein-arginine kinase activator protein McsA
MKTPAGKDCDYFYGDYFRGRTSEECRLLKDHRIPWSPYLCQECPVPEILQANSCQHQKLTPSLKRPIFFMRPQVQVSAFCNKTEQIVEEPRVGCGQCHPSIKEFVIFPDETDTPDRS